MSEITDEPLSSFALPDLIGDDAVRQVYSDYFENYVIKGESPLAAIETDDSAQRFAAIGEKVLAAYSQDLEYAKRIHDSRRSRFFRGRPDDLQIPASLAADMGTILSALGGEDWNKRLRSSPRFEETGYADFAISLASEGVAMKIVGLKVGRALFRGARVGRAGPAELIEDKILDSSKEIRERKESGQTVADILTKAAVSLTSMAAIKNTQTILRAAIPYGRVNELKEISAYSQGIGTAKKLYRGAEVVKVNVHVPHNNMMKAIAMATELVERGETKLTPEISEKLLKAVEYYGLQTYFMLQLSGFIIAGSGLNFDSASFEQAKREEADRQRAEVKADAERIRLERQAEHEQKAAQEQAQFHNLQTEVVDIIAANERYVLDWSLTNSEIKKRGLTELVGSLVRGLKDSDNNVVFPGVSKAESRQLVGAVERLNELFEKHADKDQVTEKLKEQYIAQQELQNRLQSVIENSESLGAKYRVRLRELLPQLFSTKELIEKLESGYPQIRSAIEQFHPKNDRVLASLDDLFLSTGSKDVATQLPLPDSVDPEHNLIGIAKQLDRIILPPDATLQDVKEEISKLELPEAEVQEIDWDRLFDLVRLRNSYDGILYRSKKGSFGGAPPYFVVEIKYQGRTFAVAESPVEGNATYIIDEREIGGSWLEALTHSKSEARILGAHRIIHRSGNHLDKIENCLIDLMTVA